ncbi:MAG: ABC transporter substrate-binding protein [Magnetococcales bacterium]|nr:ABC transporter substrate-binding protein [Magnetococcales bacterium]
MKRLIKLLVIPCLVAVMALWLLHSLNQPLQQSSPLRIAINPWPGFADAFVAAEKGLFTKNGVTVQLVMQSEQRLSNRTYKDGDSDGLFAPLSDVIVLATQGVLSKTVYVVDYSQSGDVIVARPGVTSLADLKGGSISIDSVHSFSHIYVLRALQSHGVDENEVRFEIITAPRVLTALEQGLIDAGHTWQPTSSRAIAKGYHIISKAGDFPGIITDVLSFTAQTVADRPKDVAAVVKSLLEARIYVEQHREEAVAIMAKATGMSEQEVSDGLSEIIRPDLRGNLTAFSRFKSTLSLYQSGSYITDFLLDRGFVRHVPRIDDLVDPKIINTLSSDRPS